jgi:hypothetical protein
MPKITLLAELDPPLEELDAPLEELLHAAARSVIAAAQATEAATLGLFISDFLSKTWLPGSRAANAVAASFLDIAEIQLPNKYASSS